MRALITFGSLFYGVRVFTGAFMLIYMMNQGLTLAEVGYIKAFQSILMMILDVPLNLFSDKGFRKISLVLAAIFEAVWLCLMGAADSFSMFMAAEFFNAVALTLIAGTYNASLVESARLKNISAKESLAKSNHYNHLSMFIFSLIGISLVNLIDASILFYISALSMAVTSVVAMYSIDNLDFQTNNKKKKILTINYKEILIIVHNYKPLFILLILVNIIFNILAQFWQVLFNKGDNIPAIELGVTFSFLLLTQSIASYTTRHLPRRFSVILANICFIIIAYLIYCPIYSQFASYCVAIILSFFAIRILLIELESSMHELINDSIRATTDSVVSLFNRVALLGLFPLIGYGIDMSGAMILSLLVLIIPILSSLLLFYEKFKALKIKRI
ncbi:MFS transporter [Piscirickettsia litoralis]|uniref:MFS transporter n=1 Tax=Piscirickettsia litoralis TaxID=1891921 RepID=A0ABX3A4Q6_9GAMM|nr:MFS transporter [Piscirickettsia litoralis]ODN43428.1 hypothetical protein BGC07_11485 [Piscirickettsia litoralis]